MKVEQKRIKEFRAKADIDGLPHFLTYISPLL